MSVVSALSHRIAALFLGIVATFRRLLCFLHITRHRKNSGSLLPLVSNHSDGLVQGEVQTSLPSNDYELGPWESWGNDSSGFGQSVPLGNNVSATASHVGNNTSHSHHTHAAHRNKTASESEQEPDIDFFSDMQPDIKKQAKILIRKKEEANRTNNLSNRLTMNSVAAVPIMQDGELTNWEEQEEGNAWGAETLEDLSWEAESALKEKRRQERERRQQEQQRRKLERERQLRNDTRLTAVKLS